MPTQILGLGQSSNEQPQCVICLETITEPVVALPCRHDCFDFPCLGSWLTRQRACPLCKREVQQLQYESGGLDKYKIFHLPPPVAEGVSNSGPVQQRDTNQHPRRRQRLRSGDDETHSADLEMRRRVYRYQLFSLHVGTNRISGYREFNPQSFRIDELLLSKAKKWIRRELQVFDFLNNDDQMHDGQRRGASNAEFLLGYIIAILKTTDIKGNNGHAEDLLKDFFGRTAARIFLHELQAWLRSPYQNLNEFDRSVQYLEVQT